MEQWIKLRTSLADDPRVLGIAARLKVKPTEIIGCLSMVWFLADTHTWDGLLPHLTPDAIDKKVDLKGFASELVKIGWIAFSEQGAEILKYREHNGKSAKRRAQDMKRKYSNPQPIPTSLADGVSSQ